MGMIDAGTAKRTLPAFAIVLIGLISLACLGFAADASAGISCRYVAAGPDGPAGNRLEIRVNNGEEVVALIPGKGSKIEVTDDQRMKPLKCAGGAPTMVNIDRVDFLVARSGTSSSLYIAEAPKFFPGATPGGKGITFLAKGPALSFGIGGTEASDLVQMGMSGKAAALDFSPESFADGESGDEIDARIYAGFVNILVRGGPGNDVIGGNKTSLEFDGPLTVPTSIYGEAGSDEILGGNFMDYLDGGPGADFLKSYGGADQLSGGPGRDWFGGGPGRDEIDAIDGVGGETIRCGRGRDLAYMDLKDLDRDCESFRFP